MNGRFQVMVRGNRSDFSLSIYTPEKNLTDMAEEDYEKSYIGFAENTSTLFMCITNLYQDDTL